MMKEGIIIRRIITIGREFGSGGRELGKRLADELGIAYYDREIIIEISKRTKLAENYVQKIVENKPVEAFPITIGQSFYPVFNPVVDHSNNIYIEQSNTLIEMAKKSNCVIVGRCSDYILKEYNPFNIFVYADLDFKIKRCKENAPQNEDFTEKQLANKILEIDKNRAKYYHFITGKKWGKVKNYDICVNTSNISIKKLAKFLADIV